MDFSDLMRQMADSDSSKMQPILGDELISLRKNFQRIENLKPGDKVRFKSEELRDTHNPAFGQIVEVFEVFPPRLSNAEAGSSHECDEADFSVAWRNGTGSDSITFFAYDSRRFERVE